MPPTVSILMSVYNNETFIEDAIQSMLDQTFTDFEFIIVDDGSTDRSPQIIQQYVNADSRIHPIWLPSNTGLAGALNRGLAEAQGDYIARMDSDDISLNERLTRQVEYLREHPEVGVLGSRMQVVDVDRKPLFVYDVPLAHSAIVWNIFFGRTFAHPSVIIKRELLESVDGYNTDLIAAQDVDLWARLIGLATFHNLPDKLILYRTHERATSINKSEEQNVILKETSRRLLQTLWGDVTEETLDLFLNVRLGKSQFSMDELENITANMTRLTLSLLEQGWIREDEIPLIIGEMERRINLAKPRQRKFWEFWHKDINT